MKATGIVRRIDDLGRLVIPKEIRRSLRIRESDPIEIYTGGDGEIILRKYARMRELSDYAPQLVQAINGAFGCTAAISDTSTVLFAAGTLKKALLGAALSKDYLAFLHRRQMLFYDDTAVSRTPLLESQQAQFLQVCGMPVTVSGDPAGSVILLSNEPTPRFFAPELQMLKTAALYLGKLLED